MSLFPPAPQEPEPDRAEAQQPEWAGPPNDLLPGIVAEERTVAQTDVVVLSLDVVAAYPTGVVFGIRGLKRDGSYLDFYGDRSGGPAEREQGLRLAVAFSDGRTAAAAAWPAHPRSHVGSTGPYRAARHAGCRPVASGRRARATAVGAAGLMSERPSDPDGNDWDSSGWLFGLLSLVVVTLVGRVAGLPFWVTALVAVLVGLLAGVAQRRWPTI